MKRAGTEGRRRRGKALLASCLISEDDTTAGAPLSASSMTTNRNKGQGRGKCVVMLVVWCWYASAARTHTPHIDAQHDDELMPKRGVW